jgi:hypothetical protein
VVFPFNTDLVAPPNLGKQRPFCFALIMIFPQETLEIERLHPTSQAPHQQVSANTNLELGRVKTRTMPEIQRRSKLETLVPKYEPNPTKHENNKEGLIIQDCISGHGPLSQ